METKTITTGKATLIKGTKGNLFIYVPKMIRESQEMKAGQIIEFEMYNTKIETTRKKTNNFKKKVRECNTQEEVTTNTTKTSNGSE